MDALGLEHAQVVEAGLHQRSGGGRHVRYSTHKNKKTRDFWSRAFDLRVSGSDDVEHHWRRDLGAGTRGVLVQQHAHRQARLNICSIYLTLFRDEISSMGRLPALSTSASPHRARKS